MYRRLERDSALSPINHRVLTTILGHVGSSGYALKQDVIAGEVDRSRRTISTVVRWLVDHGYLVAERRGNRSGRLPNLYRIGPACLVSANVQVDLGNVQKPAQQEEEKDLSVVTSVGLLRSNVQLEPSTDLGAPKSPTPTLADRAGEGQSQIPPPASAERLTVPEISAVENVLAHLENVRRGGTNHLASCPVASHGKGRGDRNPSLSISEGDGKVLVNCQTGCHTQDVLLAIGLDWPDLFDGPITDDRGVKVAEWTYQARDGSPWLVVERWETPRGKSFLQRNPATGEYKLPKDYRPALYKLPEVIQAARAGEEIFVVEGEKCVAAANRLGVVATTAPGGANKKWEDYYAKWLEGASRVTIVTDNDEVGMRYASSIAASLKGHGIPVRTVKVGVPDAKADLYDHVLAGKGLDDLVPIALNQFRPEGLDGEVLMTKEFPEVEWVVRDLMPVGFTILGGAPKTGKSFTALDCAINVSRGGDFLHTQRCVIGDVLYLSLDNDAMWRIQLRLRHLAVQYGVPQSFPRIEFHTDFPVGDAAVKGIEEWCADTRERGGAPRLVVMDTLAKIDPGYAGTRRDGGDDYNAVTANLSKWSRLAEEQRIGVLAVHHVRKSGDDDWMNRFLGSQGIPATASTLMMLDTKRGSDEGMLHVSSRDAGDQELELRRGGWGWELFTPARSEERIVTKGGLRGLPGGLANQP